MGLQSSRIIWGKTKLPGTNPVTPIELYDDSNVVYVSGNYAIYSVSHGTVDEDYRLFLCGAAETGGEFNEEDWTEQKGVKNWALAGYRVYKKGARVIKEMHGVEYDYVDEEGNPQTIILDGVYLFKCIKNTPYDHTWHADCWELQFQMVGLAYIARDHKDVYYNGKYHKAMYFVPPEAAEEADLEVMDFNEEWEYHFGDLMIHNKLGIEDGYRCYKYISHIPSSGTYADAKWEVQENAENVPIKEYKANIDYPKNYRCLKRAITIYEQVICEYDGYNLKYSTGKYCIYKIDKDDYIQMEIDAGERLYPNWYRDKIINGEDIYGLFRAKRQTGNGSSFNKNDWELINQRDGHYVLQWIPVNDGDPYEIGDERIYYFCDTDGNPSSIMGLNRCIKAHITPTMQNCPTNNEYWETEDQNIDSIDTYRLYRANRDISAADNTHFIAKYWSVITQKMELDDELYGIIWQKFGVPGDGGAPYGYLFPTYGTEVYTGGSNNEARQRSHYAYFVVTATRAKFQALTVYTINSKYSTPEGLTGTWRYTTSGDGFSEMVARNDVAYGIPRYGRAQRAHYQIVNYVMYKTSEDWKKIDLSGYIAADTYDMQEDFPARRRFSFTTIDSGFMSLEMVPYYQIPTYWSGTSSTAYKLYKYIVDKSGNLLSKAEINIPDNIKYWLYDARNGYWFENDIIKIYISTIYTNNYFIHVYGLLSNAWAEPYNGYENGIINKDGYTPKETVTSYLAKRLYAQTYGTLSTETYLIDDVVQRAHKYTAIAEKDYTTIRPIGESDSRIIRLDEFYACAAFMGLNARTETDSGGYVRYFIDNIPNGSKWSPNNSERIYINGMSPGSNFILRWYSYNYYENDITTDLKIRTFACLETISTLGMITNEIIYEHTYSTGGNDVTDTFPVDIMPLGRISNMYYLIGIQPGGTSTSEFISNSVAFINYENYKALYELNLVEKTLTKISDNAFEYVYIRYINNEYVYIASHKITKMKCVFTETVNAHRPARDEYMFEDLGNGEYAIIVGVSINDKNIFSNTSGTTVNTFTGSMFFRTQISHDNPYGDYGVYAYFPNFSLTNKTIMELTGFFWMSSGELQTHSGFYGGYDDADSFEVPLVF